MEDVDYAYTTGLDDAEIEARLREHPTGTLSLAKDDDAYAVPLVHFYDGDRLYFRLGMTEGSKKQEFLGATETACYVLYGTEPTEDFEEIESWSVIITGRLSEVPESAQERFDDAAINREFAPIRVFDEPIEAVEIRLFELEIDTMTGRATPSE